VTVGAVVAHVGDHRLTCGRPQRHVLVTEPAKPRVLHRNRIRIEGIDLDNPAEVRAVLLEQAADGAGAVGDQIFRHVVLIVFLTGEQRVPWCVRAGAITQRAADVADTPQRRTVCDHPRVCGNPAVGVTVQHDPALAFGILAHVGQADADIGSPVREGGYAPDDLGERLAVVVGVGADVFMIDGEDALVALRPSRKERREVSVEAKALAGAGEPIAVGQQHVVVESARQQQVIIRRGLQRIERQEGRGGRLSLAGRLEGHWAARLNDRSERRPSAHGGLGRCQGTSRTNVDRVQRASGLLDEGRDHASRAQRRHECRATPREDRYRAAVTRMRRATSCQS
jgi:hypothetical protein